MRATNEREVCRPVFVRLVGELRRRKKDVDRLPYTDEFDEMYAKFVGQFGTSISRSEFYWELIIVRKNYKRFAEKFGEG